MNKGMNEHASVCEREIPGICVCAYSVRIMWV